MKSLWAWTHLHVLLQRRSGVELLSAWIRRCCKLVLFSGLGQMDTFVNPLRSSMRNVSNAVKSLPDSLAEGVSKVSADMGRMSEKLGQDIKQSMFKVEHVWRICEKCAKDQRPAKLGALHVGCLCSCVYVTEKLSPCRLLNISHVGEVSALMLLIYECLSLTPDVSDP